MIISVIETDRLDMFSTLDPLDRLKFARLPGYTCIGVINDKVKSKPEPVGVLVYSLLKDKLTIEWIYVSEEYRGFGYAEMMMKAVFELAKTRDNKWICAYLTDDSRSKKMLVGREGYLLEHFFFDEDEMPGEWSIHLSQVKELEFFSKIRKPLKSEVTFRNFSQLDRNVRGNIIKAFMGQENADVSADLLADTGLLDRDCSIVCGQKNRLCGAVFIMDLGQELVLAGLSADDTDLAERLFTEACFMAEDKHSGKKKLFVSLRKKEYTDLMRVISDGRSIPVRVRYADAMDYNHTLG